MQPAGPVPLLSHAHSGDLHATGGPHAPSLSIDGHLGRPARAQARPCRAQWAAGPLKGSNMARGGE
jgi:hypothetical protein